jgi:hypothetical protein
MTTDSVLEVWIKEQVAKAPPLTPEQRDRLAVLLNPPEQTRQRTKMD